MKIVVEGSEQFLIGATRESAVWQVKNIKQERSHERRFRVNDQLGGKSPICTQGRLGDNFARESLK